LARQRSCSIDCCGFGPIPGLAFFPYTHSSDGGGALKRSTFQILGMVILAPPIFY
jgi:hypothetical protein